MGFDVRVFHDFGGGVAGASRYASIGKKGTNFLLGFVGGPGFNSWADDIFLVFAPAGSSGEARVGEPFGFADYLTEAFPLVLSPYLYHEPAVGCLETGQNERATRLRIAHHAHRFVLKLHIG